MPQRRKQRRKSPEERGMEMDEYIKKETAYRAIMGERPEAREPSWFAELVLEIPAADVVLVRHGRWIDRIDTDTNMHECSVCGARVVKGLYEYENPNRYCYHCGAKMDL